MRSRVMSTFAVVTPAARRILVGNLISAIGSGVTLPFLIIYLGRSAGSARPRPDSWSATWRSSRWCARPSSDPSSTDSVRGRS